MEQRQYHIAMKTGDVGRYVLLPGDPGRVEKIAARLSGARLIAVNREYTTYTGELDGAKVSVTSTGIGGPSTAIAVEELRKIGADTFVRVGTCGGMQKDVRVGDVVIATGAIRAEGTSREYLPIDFPAVASYPVLRALDEAAAALSLRRHTGVVQCKDSFYGQHEPERMPVSYELTARWQAWIRGGCLASEMETAALFVIASTLGARAGSLCYVAGNQERRALGLLEDSAIDSHDVSPAIDVAIEALRRLIRSDAAERV